MKECPSCYKLIKPEDFIFSDNCYRCVYAKKMQLLKQKKGQLKNCKFCRGEMQARKRNYCSPYCAKESYKNQMRNYWRNQMNFVKIIWD